MMTTQFSIQLPFYENKKPNTFEIRAKVTGRNSEIKIQFYAEYMQRCYQVFLITPHGVFIFYFIDFFTRRSDREKL